MQHQTHTTTNLDRYPDIFQYVKSIFPNPLNILSFGCSSGEECFSLQKYFPQSNIFGVDINNEALELAKSNNKFELVKFFNSIDVVPNVDIIFTMSVFCRWPETSDLEHNNIYHFNDFNEEILSLDKKINNNGLFVIYNSNYYFSETSVSEKYSYIDVSLRDEFVRKFDKNGKYSTIKSPILFLKNK